MTIRTYLSILLFGLLGSVVRFLYGFFHEPWNLAADHIAWEIIVQNGGFVYSELIHYPHEGGTVVLTLMAKMVTQFTSFNALAITAFILDFLIRCIQIWIVKKVFGSPVFLAFGIFTIFTYPIMIPWASVNFGLHAISSVFPFLFLFFIFTWNSSLRYQLSLGLFIGVSIWFSYSNSLFIPILLGYLWVNRKQKFRWRPMVLSCTGILLLHVLTRIYFDPGFHLSSYAITSIRGTDISLFSISTLKNLALTANSIANGAAISHSNDIHILVKFLFIGFTVLASFGWLRTYLSGTLEKSHKLLFILILLFLFLYGISPFAYTNSSNDYILYRHLTYIFPLFGLFLLIGLQNTQYKIMYSFFFIFTGIVGSTILIEPRDMDLLKSPNQSAGWVLGTKFGHDPQRLTEIISPISNKEDLIIGIGWGMTSSFFERSTGSKLEQDKKITHLRELMLQFPTSYQAHLVAGIKKAFSPNVTPVLAKDILIQWQSPILQTINPKE